MMLCRYELVSWRAETPRTTKRDVLANAPRRSHRCRKSPNELRHCSLRPLLQAEAAHVSCDSIPRSSRNIKPSSFP